MSRSLPRLLGVLLVAASVPALPVAAGDLVVSGSLVSTVATGTPPLAVSSTTKVDGLNADFLDGLDGSAFARSLGNVVRVGMSGGDFTSIQAALDSITTASAANPFLVLVGPGVYAERVVMKPFVDIQGAGEGVTRITQSGGTTTERGTVAGADNAELRFLTVENAGGSDFVYGVYNNGTSPRLVHVTVEVDGAVNPVWGITNTADAATELLHVTVLVEGIGTFGVYNAGDNARMEHVRVEVGGGGGGAKYGVYNAASGIVLDDVEIVATSAGTTAQVYGLVNLDVVDATIRGVRVEASGGGFRFGVNNAGVDSISLRDLTVRVSAGDSTGYGVLNEFSTVLLENCSIIVEGGPDALAVRYSESSGAITDCTLEATGATSNFGLSVFGSPGPFAVDVHHSRVRGATSAIGGSSDYTLRVGASQLDGAVSAGPTYTCIYSYDGNFDEVICH